MWTMALFWDLYEKKERPAHAGALFFPERIAGDFRCGNQKPIRRGGVCMSEIPVKTAGIDWEKTCVVLFIRGLWHRTMEMKYVRNFWHQYSK